MNNKTNIEEDINIVRMLLENLVEYGLNCAVTDQDIQAIENILADRENYKNNYDSLVEKIKEIKAQSEKENKPYEEYNKESRMYWINEGKKSVCQELLDTEK